jgi:hypothetical protein
MIVRNVDGVDDGNGHCIQRTYIYMYRCMFIYMCVCVCKDIITHLTQKKNTANQVNSNGRNRNERERESRAETQRGFFVELL